MTQILIAFRSRNETMRYHSSLSSRNIPCKIINTPKEAYAGCGLSVLTLGEYYDMAVKALSYFGYRSYAGIFSVEDRNGKRIVKPI